MVLMIFESGFLSYTLYYSKLRANMFNDISDKEYMHNDTIWTNGQQGMGTYGT